MVPHECMGIRRCEVDLISVSFRQLLKYNFYVIMHREVRRAFLPFSVISVVNIY